MRFRFFLKCNGYGGTVNVSLVIRGLHILLTPGMTDSLHHRSYHNLKAFRSAFTLHTDLFWLSRGFPVSLDFSLTRPMRAASEHVIDEVLAAWRSRSDTVLFDVHLHRALDQVRILEQYLVRARAEEVVGASDFLAFSSRIENLSSLIKRLPRHVSVAA